MSFSPKEYNDLLSFFSEESSARHIISLALNEVNNNTTTTTTTTTTIAYAETTSGGLEDIFGTANDTFLVSSTAASVGGNHSVDASVATRTRISADIPFWLIPCYSIILLFAIVGNVLVITTLVQNRRMRTITNVFLLNLAISDILLGVLCMPVTLVGTLLRHFIFGEFLCKFIPFAQAASVAVSSWTLVAISCERYYAICHPLKSRTWQTLSHAYKIIGFIWCGSIVCMTPIAVFSQLIPTSRQGLRKCREHWPADTVGYERSYNIFLDLILLVLPLIILCVAYILITRTLYVSMQEEQAMICGRAVCGAALGSAPNKPNAQSSVTATTTTTTTTLVQGKRPTRSSSGCNLNVSFRCHIDGVSGRTTAIVDDGLTESAHGNKNANHNDNNGDDSAGCGNGGGGVAIELDGIAISEQRNNRQTTPLNAETRHVGGGDMKRKLLTPTDGRHLAYCIRSSSSSAKSLNRNNNETDPIDVALASEASVMATPSMTVINVHPHGPFPPRARTCPQQLNGERERRKSNSSPSLRVSEAALRRSNVTKNLESKKRVVKMLFVLVLEFFVCWTPLYVINTVAMFIGPAIYEYIDYTSISFFQLLAYSSSCCNPITYCFMNAGFRRAFLDTFRGLPPLSAAATAGGRFWRKHHKHQPTNADMNLSMAGNSITMANSVTNTMLDSPRL